MSQLMNKRGFLGASPLPCCPCRSSARSPRLPRPAQRPRRGRRPGTPDGQPDLRGTWVNFDSTPFETAGAAAAGAAACRSRHQSAVALGRPRQPDEGAAAVDGRRSARRKGAGDEVGGRQARVRSRSRRRPLGAPDAVGAVHHARHAGGHVSGRLQQRLPVHPDAGLRRHRLRDDSRGAHHPARRPPARRREHPPVGRRLRAGTGTAPRSSSTRRTTTTRDRSRPAPRPARIRGIPQSEALHVVERFTPVDANTIKYRVTVDDKNVYTKPWTVEMPLTRDSKYHMFEYACEEGNYATPNILAGARKRRGRAGQTGDRRAYREHAPKDRQPTQILDPPTPRRRARSSRPPPPSPWRPPGSPCRLPASPNVPVDLAGLLARVGDRVEAYYARAQSIICVETVHLQPMDYNFAPKPHVRRLVYELRVSREQATGTDAAPEANVLRQLRTVDGRPPKPNEEPGCLDPKPVSLDPLSFLLPQHQREYMFSYKGSGRTTAARSR